MTRDQSSGVAITNGSSASHLSLPLALSPSLALSCSLGSSPSLSLSLSRLSVSALVSVPLTVGPCGRPCALSICPSVRRGASQSFSISLPIFLHLSFFPAVVHSKSVGLFLL